jgi:hypothetical protein
MTQTNVNFESAKELQKARHKTNQRNIPNTQQITMLRSNFEPLQRLPATEALERLVKEDSLCQDTVLKSLSLSFPTVTGEDIEFPSLSWFPEEEEASDEPKIAKSTGLSAMSLCSIGSSCSDMSCDTASSWKQVDSFSFRRRGSGNASSGLQRSKRLASELCMLRSDSDERETKRRSTMI